MASFEREQNLVNRLLARLDAKGATTLDPNVSGQETGIDVTARFSDGRTVGVQVTEIDPYSQRGQARAQEKRLAKENPEKPYFMWVQNNSEVLLTALSDSIERKVKIAVQHSFDGCDEVWLLVCAGIPEYGAVASTLVMTPWLAEEDLNSTTDNLLRNSKYDRCFLLPILGVEQAFFQWNKNGCWKKSVQLEDISSMPREAYIKSLMGAAEKGDWQEVDRLCDEECKKVLSELRR